MPSAVQVEWVSAGHRDGCWGQGSLFLLKAEGYHLGLLILGASPVASQHGEKVQKESAGPS